MQKSFNSIFQLQIPANLAIFGVELSHVFDASQQLAPQIVIMLTQEIERQARHQKSIDLYKLYRTKVPLDNLNELRELLNTSGDLIDLGNFEIQYLVSILNYYGFLNGLR